MTWMAAIVDDLRTGLVSAFRRPGLTVAVALPIALATAVTSALFAVVDGLYFRPLPLRNADRTLVVSMPKGDRLSALVGILIDPRQADQLVTAFETSPLFDETFSAGRSTGFHVQLVSEIGLNVSGVDPRVFDGFGLRPALGRVLNEDDLERTERDVARALPLPVVFSDRFWRDAFGGDPAILNRTLELAGRQVQPIGVMAPGVKFPGHTDVWTPRGTGPANRLAGYVHVAPGVSIEAVRSAFPLLDFTWLRAHLIPLDSRGVVFVFVFTLALLGLAWAQVGSLRMTAVEDQLPALSLRRALGATRWRLVSHQAAEAFWLAAAGLLVALPLIPVTSRYVISVLPSGLTAEQYLDPSARTLLFGVLVSGIGFVLLMLSSLPMLLRLTGHRRGEASLVLRGTHVRRPHLLVLQVCCTVLLVYAATAAVLSYGNVSRFDYGFDAEHVAVIRPGYDSRGLTGEQHTAAFVNHGVRVAESAKRIASLPFVRSATTLMDSPMPFVFDIERLHRGDDIRIAGRPVPTVAFRVAAGGEHVVETLGLSMVAGTTFADPEYRGRLDVAMVSERMAARLSPITSVLNQHLRARFVNVTIIGIFKDVMDAAPNVTQTPLLLMRSEAPGVVGHLIAVRTQEPAAQRLGDIQRAVEEDFGPIRATQVRLLADDVNDALQPWLSRSQLLGLVAGLALPLAGLGLASGFFVFVRQRYREFGIRLALGATPSVARRLVLGFAARVLLVGGAVGLAAGVAASLVAGSWLFGVDVVSPTAILGACVLMAVVVWMATLVPAWRASRVDPASVLRAD